jgi:hypothetical protein
MAHKHGGHHRRRHRNPEGMDLVWGAGGVIGGWWVNTSIVSSIFPSGFMNYLAEGGAALLGGWALAKVKKPLGWGFGAGALAALAIKLYGDFVGGAAGVSGYVDSNSPTLEFLQGDALKLPAYSPGGAPVVVPQAGSSGASAVAAKTGSSVQMTSPRFQSRLLT